MYGDPVLARSFPNLSVEILCGPFLRWVRTGGTTITASAPFALPGAVNFLQRAVVGQHVRGYDLGSEFEVVVGAPRRRSQDCRQCRGRETLVDLDQRQLQDPAVLHLVAPPLLADAVDRGHGGHAESGAAVDHVELLPVDVWQLQRVREGSREARRAEHLVVLAPRGCVVLALVVDVLVEQCVHDRVGRLDLFSGASALVGVRRGSVR